MRTYLVTGGAGFIGSNYIHYMFKKYDNEIRIINVDVLTYAGNLENLKDIEDRENYTFVKADICDKEAISKIFAENDIDRVVHFAARVTCRQKYQASRSICTDECTWYSRYAELREGCMGAAGWHIQGRKEVPACIDR